jgi:2-polyprenyl-3-methyl-5-hydroxy-6-metoxy-1,4-benzoquinol methylase
MDNISGSHAFGMHYRLPGQLVDRVDYILKACVGKKVLHLGCADYGSSGDWENTLRTGRWLHAKIERVAREVIGVDSSVEAIKVLKEKHNIENLFVGDAQQLEKLGKGCFDIIVAGEIIEHLSCPGNFLNSARTILRNNGEIIITTVNAYCVRRFCRIPFGVESVHPDHVAYYSHRTIERLADIHGFEMIYQCSYRITHNKPLLPYYLEKIASLISPNLCEGIIGHMKKT